MNYLSQSSEYYQIAKSAVEHALGRGHDATKPDHLKVGWADGQEINPDGIGGKTLVVELRHPSLDGVVTVLSHGGAMASTHKNGNGFSHEWLVRKTTYQRAIADEIRRIRT